MAMASCSLMHDDLPPCATPPNVTTIVDFVYDYNVQDEDLFADHVGSVYLYIFDSNGIFIDRYANHREFTQNPGAYIELDSTVIRPGNSYYLLAMAMGNYKGYSASLDDQHAFEVVTPLVPGVSSYSEYAVRLDRNQDGRVDFRDYYQDLDNNVLIDTLWSTRPGTVQRLDIPAIEMGEPDAPAQPDIVNHVTIEMMRLTNKVEISLQNHAFTSTMDPDSYTIKIDFPHGNGTVTMTGSTDPSTMGLQYYALRKQMIPHKSSRADADGSEWDLNATFGLSRLQVGDESALVILNADESSEYFRLDNFSDILAHYMNPEEQGWGDQEFLDREYNFEITMPFTPGEQPQWMDISISILGWTRRIWFVDL